MSMKTLAVLETTLPVACCTPLDAPSMSDEEAAASAALFKALGDPSRVRIVNLLARADEGVCVCELVPAVGLSQPTVSHHLRKLADAGLLRREQRGTWAYYSLDPVAVERLQSLTTFAEVLT
jgi:ArsR family transcriptional regulator, arsenate/arsenite/antimonite-responsive transcriptional repressor